MFRWLTILAIVLLGFLVVLLFLGYLLKENEKTVIKYQQQQSATKQTNAQVKQSLKEENQNGAHTVTLTDLKPSYAEKLVNIIASNQTCQNNSQCKLVTLEQGDNKCYFAVNSIGSALIKKLSFEKGKLPQCDSELSVSQAICITNICTIK